MRAGQPVVVTSGVFTPNGAHNVVFKGMKSARRIAALHFDVTATVENTDGVNPHDASMFSLFGAIFALMVATWPGARLKLSPGLFFRLVRQFVGPVGIVGADDVTFTAGQSQVLRFGVTLPLCDQRTTVGQTDTAQPTELVEGQQLAITFGTGSFDTNFSVTAATFNVLSVEIPGAGKVAPAILDVGFEDYAGSKLALAPGAYSDLFIFDRWSPVSTGTVTSATVEVDGAPRFTSLDTRQLVQLANTYDDAELDEASPLDVPLLTPGGRDYVTTQLPLAGATLAVQATGATGLDVGWIRRTPRTPGDVEQAIRAFGSTGQGRVKTASGKPLSIHAARYASVLPFRLE